MRTNLPEAKTPPVKSRVKPNSAPINKADARRVARVVAGGLKGKAMQIVSDCAQSDGAKASAAKASVVEASAAKASVVEASVVEALGGRSKGAGALIQEKLKKTLAHAHMRRMAPVSVQDEEILPASALICHIMLLNSVLERSSNRFCEAHGLTFPQWMALGCIGHCGEEGIRHSELGNHLMLSKAPVTGVVDRLERGGFVERRADANDRRVSRVVITPKGDLAWRQVRDTLRERSRGVCEGLSQDEQAQLLGFLARLLEDAARADPILSSPLEDN